MLSGVAIPRPLASHIVLPQACFVATKRSQPDGVTQNNEATLASYANHLGTHRPRGRDMFGHIGGIHHVKGIVGEGKTLAIGSDGGGRR